MGTEPRTISKADALAEAYKRGLLPPDKKAAYEEAQRRGLVGGGQPAAVAQPAAPQAAPPAPVGKPGAGFEMAPSSPQARRDMMGAQPPQPMAAAPGAQYSWTPPAEAGTPEQFAAARTGMDARAKAEADRVAAEAQAAREAQLAAERREASRAYGAGMDMIISTDDQGQLRPGSGADADGSKGILTSPQHGANAVIQAAESGLNLWPDALNGVFRKLTGSGNGLGNFNPDIVPRFSFPKVPIPEGMESFSGSIGEGLAQFLLSRKLVGSVAPGGGLAANLGKDAVAVGVGFDGSTGRMADMFDLNAIPEGPLRDYARFLQTQPDDSPIVGRFKNMLEDMTMSGPMLAPQGVVRAGQAVGNMIAPKPMAPANAGGAGVQAAMAQSRAAPQPPPVGRPAPAAAQPSVSPVAQPTVTQGPRGGAQPGATGAGQQAAGAVPPAGPATLQGVATQPPISKQQALIDRDTIKITRRIMRSAGIKDADVMGYLPGAVKRFESLNDPRIPLAFFLKSDLPKHFPEEVANRVGTNLDVWGRARNAETGVNDTSRATINKTITELRKTQQDFLTQSAERNLFKGSLIGQEDQIVASLRETGRKGYEPVLDNARQAVDGRRVPTQDEAAAVEEIRGILSDPMMLGYVDDATRIRAKKEGVDLDQMLKDDPIGSAHWLQSEFRRLSDAAEDAVTGKPTRMSQAYDDLRDMVLDPLKRAAPGYEGAMNRYGHLYGAKDAVRFGKGIFTAGRSAYDTAQKVRAFKKLGRRQQTVAWKSVRDEFLNEFRGTPEDAAAKVTRMQSEGALDILEQLGPRGKRFADDIRSIAQVENPNLRAIEQKSGPVTYDNQRGGVNAQDMVQSPFNQTVGQFGNPKSVPMTIVGDVLLAQAGYPPLLTLSKGVSWTIDKFGNPSKKVLARATEGLYGLPKGNALTSPAKPKRVTGPKSPAAAALEAEEAEDMAELLRALDQTEKNPKTRGGRKGQAILNKIDAAAKAPPANRLKAPKPPPAKTGGKKPPQSNASPMVTSALLGGAAGAAAAPEDARGIGLVAGLAGGAFLGNRLSKMGGSKPKTVKPPPGGRVDAPSNVQRGPWKDTPKPPKPVSERQKAKARLDELRAIGLSGKQARAVDEMSLDSIKSRGQATPDFQRGVEVATLRGQGIADEQIVSQLGIRGGKEELDRLEELVGAYDWGHPAMRPEFYANSPEQMSPMEIMEFRQLQAKRQTVTPFRKPAPGAGGKPQPVGAKAAPPPFKPIEGAERIDTTSWTPTEFNAARKQLNEMMQDRRTMSGQQLAELDREITSLRNALDPPIAPEFADVPMASRFNAPVDQPWPKGSPADTAIKKAIEGKNWTVQSVPLAKIIPTQDSVFFDYAKAAGRYAGDDRLPIVVKQGDQYFVADGHHRLMAQGGAGQVRARVIDLAPSKGPGGKPPTGTKLSAFPGGTAAQAASGAGGAAYGYANPVDANEDGVIDDQDRAITATTLGLGGLTAAGLARNALSRGPRGVKSSPGKLNTFGGVNAKTADRAALARAQQMETAGASRDDIWDATGWFKGVDGKWRFEIDDSGAKLANFYDPATFPKVQRAHVPQKPGEYTPQALDFEDYMSHPELERAYFPTREKAPSVIFDNLGVTKGSYSEANDMLTMDSASFLAKDEGRSTALHELQHGVQAREGFARGGNPTAQRAALEQQRSQSIAATYDEMRGILDQADRNVYDAWNELVRARVVSDFDWAGQIEAFLSASEDGKRLLDLDWKARSTAAGTVDEAKAYEAYRRLAGETEARNVQTRRDFSPAERKAKRPWETQDVPDDQQIVRFGGGKAESRPTKPPPASNAFGGGKGKPKPEPARKPPSALGGIAGRAAVGGAIGAGVGSIAEGQTGDTQAQMAEVAAQMAKLQKTIDGLQAVLDIYDTGTPEQIQAAVARGGKYTKPDGVIGPETSARVEADRARIAGEMKTALAEMDKGRARVKQLEEQAAFENTRPGMAWVAARQAAPWIGALGGALGGAKMRGGAVSKATAEAVKREASVNALLTPGPIKTGRDAATRAAVKGQPANINEYWIRGGAGDKVPFETNAKGDWRMRPKAKVMPASKLFPDGNPGLRKNDLAWIATGLSEAGLSTLGVDAAHKELAAAQAAVENDKTEANYERLERAHDMLALAETMQRAGLGFAAGRLIGAYKTPYKSARPNVQNAEAEMARIAEYLQRLKK